MNVLWVGDDTSCFFCYATKFETNGRRARGRCCGAASGGGPTWNTMRNAAHRTTASLELSATYRMENSIRLARH